MSQYQEKRQYPRKEGSFPFRYRETLGTPSPFRGALVKDVSLGGLRFRTEDFLPLDTSLILELSLPESTRPVRAITRVAWSRKLSSGERYEIGGEFVEMIPSEKRSLEGFLEAAAGGNA